jgi:hypothetical protein
MNIGWLLPTDSPATFTAFVNSVYRTTGSYPADSTWDPDTYDLGDDIDEIANDLQNTGFTNANYDPYRLLRGMPAGANYRTVMRQLTTVIQVARNTGAIGPDLDYARAAIQGIVDQRLADNVAGETRYFTNYLASFGGGFLPTVETVVMPSGRTVSQIDWTATFTNLGGSTIAQRMQDVVDMVNFYYQDDGGSGRTHDNNIREVKVNQDRIWNPDTTC